MGEPKAVDDDGANTVEGEDGTTPGEGETGGAGPAATPPSGDGASGIDPMMRIEIDLLTYETCIRIADTIARRCRPKLLAASRTLLVAPPGAAATIGRARALGATVTALRDAIERIARTAPISRAEERRDAESADSEATESAFAAAQGTIDQAAALLGSVKGILDTLAVVDRFDGRDVAIDPTILAAIVASRCLRAGMTPVLVADSQLPTRSWRESGSLASLIAAVEKLRFATLAGEAAADAAAKLLTRADAVVETLKTPEAGAPLALLDLVNAHEDAPLLTVQLLAAGGAYRTRSHLFTALGFAEKLSISAGAAIHFALRDRASGTLLAGDLLLDSSGHVRLPGAVTERRIGNLADDPSANGAAS